MPSRKTIRLVYLNSNKITIVGGPESYEYCQHCFFRLDGNPLQCNFNLMRMIIWFREDDLNDQQEIKRSLGLEPYGLCKSLSDGSTCLVFSFIISFFFSFLCSVIWKSQINDAFTTASECCKFSHYFVHNLIFTSLDDVMHFRYEEMEEFVKYINENFKDDCVYNGDSLNCSKSSITQVPRNPPNTLTLIKISDNVNLTSIPDGIYKEQLALKT